MKTLSILIVNVLAGEIPLLKEDCRRGKLILIDKEERPSYIEADNYEVKGNKYVKTDETIIRIHFNDDSYWNGTMGELKKKLICT